MSEIRGLQAWMKLILHQQMPALDFVVQQICQLDERNEGNADDLAKIVLRDASLTAKVLRVANAVHYNRSGRPIQTVSRAIIQVGFVEIKNITLASSLIDSFLQGKPRQLLLQQLTQSFHAAVQARALVPRADAAKRELVFIAALLRHLGKLALLVTREPAAEHFVRECREYPDDEHAIAMKYLGIGIDSLTRELVREWKLGDHILEAVQQNAAPGSVGALVNLADSISQHLAEGLQSARMLDNCAQVAQLCQLTLEESQQLVLLTAEEAALTANQYNAESLVPMLPSRAQILAQSETQQRTGYEFSMHLNTLLKLQRVSDSMSRLLHATVICLQEGVGLPRVALLLMDYHSKSFVPSYVAGRDTQLWRNQAAISLEQLRKGEVLYELLRQDQMGWHKKQQYAPELGALSQFLPYDGDCFVASVRVDKRLFGLLYADAAGKTLDDRQQTEFELTAQLLTLMLQQSDGKAVD
jgi:HD-like signal output (HDOD) protein